jgi:hypothetical protein
MCSSSAASKSPMAEFLKSQTPEELWKASLKPKDPLKQDDPTKIAPSQTIQAVKAPGTGLVVDVSA